MQSVVTFLDLDPRKSNLASEPDGEVGPGGTEGTWIDHEDFWTEFSCHEEGSVA